jgi:hypothetical protein
MSLVSIILVIIVVGVLLWLAEKYIPMDATIRRLLIAVVVIALVLWLLSVFGLLDAINSVHVGKVHR